MWRSIYIVYMVANNAKYNLLYKQMRFRNVCADFRFSFCLVLFFFFLFFDFLFIFLFAFCKLKKIAQMGRDITQIIERSLHATAACPAHKLLTQLPAHTHTQTHRHTPLRCYIYLVSIYLKYI